MMLNIPGVLSREQVRHCHEVLATASWIDGRATAGEQSGRVKANLQLAETSAEAKVIGELVLKALGASAPFMSAALPLKVFPPLINRYCEGMGFGAHIDNAIRASPLTGARYRTDLSCTLFLTDPDQYHGGELVIGEGFGAQQVKLPAGDLILYPATTVHRVEPISRGERWAAFFWVQSMVADDGRRTLLHEMDRAITTVRTEMGDAHPACVSLTGSYHNLLRMWSQV